MKQNVYDQEDFFNEFSRIRQNPNNHNDLIEQPAIKELLPDLNGLDILDLGCGNGLYSKELMDRKANSVLGVDISNKMITEARKLENENLTFKELAMEEISKIPKQFDLVISSLAFHYVEDFNKLLKDISCLLKSQGYLIFSQEHPLATCFDDKHHARWTRDNEGKKQYANIAEYSIPGERKATWLDTEVIKYHRPFSEIINGLVEAGFHVECMKEPLGLENEFKDNIHRPDFLIIRAKKQSIV